MTVITGLCMKCSVETVQRLIRGSEMTTDMLRALDGIDFGHLMPRSVAVCSVCGFWTVTGVLSYLPARAARDRFRFQLKEKD